MKMLLIAPIACLMLAGCETPADIDFERMSDIELAAYNNSVSLNQMIICEESASITSRIRRKTCRTMSSLYGKDADLDAIGAAAGGASFGRAVDPGTFTN